MKIEKGKFVEVSYELIADGEMADMATAESPLGFVFGEGFLIPGFEKNIEGKQAGDSYDFTLSPEDGYGVSKPEMIVDVPKAAFEVNDKVEAGLLEVGNEIPMQTTEGMRFMGRVAAIDGDTVRMDFNHPMAGKTLRFSGSVVNVREATDADYPQTGGCGCGCNDSGCNSDDCGGSCS
jgi:FKBP-type peptidyl-prolyl cis-trans isomerase SlyD